MIRSMTETAAMKRHGPGLGACMYEYRDMNATQRNEAQGRGKARNGRKGRGPMAMGLPEKPGGNRTGSHGQSLGTALDIAHAPKLLRCIRRRRTEVVDVVDVEN